MKRFSILIFYFPIVIYFFASCQSKNDRVVEDEGIGLVSVGDSVLHVRDVEINIPSGLSKADSLEMFNSFVERWVMTMMLKDIAAKNYIDMVEINRIVDDYKNSLIIEHYLQRKNDNTIEISKSKIDDYYEKNKESLKLESPIVKGFFLKVSEKEERLSDLRRWFLSGSEKSVDNIEKYGLRHASQYEYFKDRWIEWSSIAEQIPYRFFDADAFLNSTSNFETSYGGSVYLLRITEYISTGSDMPREYAESVIKRNLEREDRSLSRKNLLKSIYKEGIKEGILKPGLYNPLNLN